jgi:subtilisin family serine protease
MAREMLLSYGGADLLFKESEELVAIMPAQGGRPRLEADIQRSGFSDHGDVGEYVLIDISAQDDVAVDAYLEVAVASLDNARVSKVFYTSDDGVPLVPTGKIYLEFRDGSDVLDLQKLLRDNGLQILEARGKNALIAGCGKNAGAAVGIAAALQADPDVSVAEPDMITEGDLTSFVPQDEFLNLQWYLKNEGSHYGSSIGFKRGADARVVEAWREAGTLGNPQILVAIIDDGFDLSHHDLGEKGRVRAPFDFKRGSSDPSPDLSAKDWHGTACAGVAVGRSDAKGVVGAAPNCSFMPIRWGTSLSDESVEAWFRYVTENCADVVSCSWSARAKNYPLSTRKQRAISDCATVGRKGLGCIICFAADNNGRDINEPARTSVNGFAIHPDVIAVAACTSMDERSDYSSFGDAIWVAAPSSGAGGWGVTTSDVTGTYTRDGATVAAGYSPGDYTNDFGGTSSACPLVAGVCALVLSVRPDLSSRDLKEILKLSARKIGNDADYDEAGRSKHFGWGCINAEAAVRVAREYGRVDS